MLQSHVVQKQVLQMKRTVENMTLRSWLAEQIKISAYAVEQLKHLKGSNVLEYHADRLVRYQAKLLSLDEYEEWLTDSCG